MEFFRRDNDRRNHSVEVYLGLRNQQLQCCISFKMRFFLAASLAANAVVTAAVLHDRTTNYVGYLISTFTDANPKVGLLHGSTSSKAEIGAFQVQLYLSNGNSPSSFRFLNKGQPVLTSTVGQFREIWPRSQLISERNESCERSVSCYQQRTECLVYARHWFVFSTHLCLVLTTVDLDVKAPGFSWERVQTTGSKALVVWSSTDLVNWSSSRLAT
jgi:hypothetical protein